MLIINKTTIIKSLKRSLYFFIIMIIIGFVRVKLLGPVGNKAPGSAPPNFHIATWSELYDELYYIFGCAVGGALTILPISFAELSDKERKRMELEKKEKEGGIDDVISEDENLSKNQ